MHTSNTTKRVIKSWLEDDVHGLRSIIKTRPETVRWTKRYTNQKERREGKRELRDEARRVAR